VRFISRASESMVPWKKSRNALCDHRLSEFVHNRPSGDLQQTDDWRRRGTISPKPTSGPEYLPGCPLIAKNDESHTYGLDK